MLVPWYRYVNDLGPEELFDAAAKATARSRRMTPQTPEHILNPRNRLILELEEGAILDHFWIRTFVLDDFILLVVPRQDEEVLTLFEISTGSHTSKEYELQSITALDYQAIQQSKSIMVALALYSDTDGSTVQIDEYTVEKEMFGFLKTHFVMSVADIDEVPSVSVVMKDDRVLVTWRDGIVVCDWRHHTALKLCMDPSLYHKVVRIHHHSKAPNVLIIRPVGRPLSNPIFIPATTRLSCSTEMPGTSKSHHSTYQIDFSPCPSTMKSGASRTPMSSKLSS